MNIVGCDESGKGDYFGGLHLCCVKCFNDIKSFKESKAHEDGKIKDIYNKIKTLKEEGLLEYKCISLKASYYNKYYKKFNNINRLMDFLYERIIKELKDNNTQKIIIDRYSEKTNLPFDNLEIYPKADEKNSCVGIASILARYSFLKELNEIRKNYSFLNDKNIKGASKEIKSIVTTIIENGVNMEDIIKLNFKI